METLIIILAMPYLILGFLFWVMVIGVNTFVGWCAWGIFLLILVLLHRYQYRHRVIKWLYWGGLLLFVVYFPLAIYVMLGG